MRPPDAIITILLNRWTAEEFTLEEFLEIMQRAGWTKREVYAYLERECDLAKSQLSEGNR